MVLRYGAAITRAAIVSLTRSRYADFLALVPALILALFWFGLKGAAIVVAVGLPLAAVSRSRGWQSDQVKVEIQIDEITGLPRVESVVLALDQIFEQVKVTGRMSACLVVSIDEPHSILERFGQSAHDNVLRKTGERIQAQLRDNDILTRMEGSRFAVALAPSRRTDLEAAIQVASRFKSAIAEPMSIDAMSIYVTASVGFCMTGRAPEKTGASILAAAELALEDARRCGPAATRAYSLDMQTAAAQRGAMRDEIDAALDNGEIIAFYQPQISTDTGEVTGFEALARWIHPERGILTPNDFLPMLCNSGLSQRLGEVILVHALAALRNWDKAGLKVPAVSVNFSKDELRNPTLASKLKWELDRFDLRPERLTVEVLESVVAEDDNDMVVQNISTLSKLGCPIDLDDFGTGHASITNIRRFIVDRIKIDRTFVTHVDKDPKQQQIIAAILSMAERLKIETLAEGVETAGEHALLAQLGCSHVQGYVVAGPMTFEETLGWLADHRAQNRSAPKINRRTG